MTINIFYICSLLLNLIIFFNYKKISKIINIYDFPDKRKLHREKTPLIGGFILILNLIFFSLLYFFEQYDEQNQNYFFASKNNFIVFFLSISVIFLLGAFDDKLNLNPNLKLFLLTIIISLTLWFDSSLIIYSLNFSFLSSELFLGKYSFIFSVLCFLLFINACNMFDGINLQSSSYFIILILYLIIIGINNDLINIILFSLILIFILNRNGKIFMGDSGVYLLAFIFSYIFIKIYNFDNKLTSDLIFILMMVPGIDMFRLFILRILSKKNPFSPDRKHIHHLLLNKFSSLKTLVILNFLILYPIILALVKFPKFIIILIFLFQYIALVFYLEKKTTKNDK